MNFKEDDFVHVGSSLNEAHGLPTNSYDYFSMTWMRLKQHKLAMFGLVTLLVLTVFSIVAPIVSQYDYQSVNESIKNMPPSLSHLFGTDQLGRDLWTRVWQGGRVSIFIGIAGGFISVLIGCIYAGLASYFGGHIDLIMMRVCELLDSIPHLLVVITMSLVFDSKSIPTLMLALLVTSWCSIARILRAQMLLISKQDYVLAARGMGVSSLKIVLTHIIPNCMSMIIVNLTFKIPGLIFSEAFLSYVGLGVQSPATSWGALSSASAGLIMFYPYQLFFPTLMIALTMLSFMLLGDGLREAMDPRLWR